MRITDGGLLVAAGALGAAGLLVALAGSTLQPVPLTKFTEQREDPLAEHLVTAEELGLIPARPKHRYPQVLSPGLSAVISGGFPSPRWQAPDPLIRALPSEEMW